MRYKIEYLLLLFILFCPPAFAAHISGSVYDYTLEPLNDVVLEVDSVPKQKFISKDGQYHFELPTGVYILTAEYTTDTMQRYYVEERINITSDGDFNFDLIMFPTFEDEEALSEGFEIDTSDIVEDDGPDILLIFLVVLSLFILLMVTFWLLRRRSRKVEGGTDETYDQVLAIIKKHKRITQKEIRKKIPLSEAKISLVITELEDRGIIRKIKKGRGNIIVLK